MAELIQLGLTALISAPVLQTVFQAPDKKPLTDERTRFLQNALHGGQFQSGQETRADLQQTERVEDSNQPRQEQSQDNSPQPQDPNMGLLSVLTGNINPPTPDMSSPATRDASNAHGTISNDLTATTVGPTTNQALIRDDTAKTGFEHGTDTRDRVERSESPVTPTRDGHRAATPLAPRGATPERTATPLARSPTPLGDRSPTPAPRSATTETGPTPGATGDGYSPLPVVPITTGDRAPSPLPDSVRGERADLDVRDGFEQGVPARQGVDGHYEGIRGEESASRPPLGDDKPSRSYIKRPDSIIGTTGTGANSPLRHAVPQETAPPRSVDYATATPATLGHPEQPVVSLPAGGALHPEAQGENGYPSSVGREGTQVRQLAGEPQYRGEQQQQYGQYAAPVAAGGIAGAAAYGVHHHQQQQQQQQQHQQQYNQPYQTDPSFTHERAMSPGPNQFIQDPSTQMSRLSFQDPAHQGQQGQHVTMNGVAPSAGVGPSPGPPVSAFAPTAARRTPEPTTGADLARNSTMRSTATGGGLSRGSTLRRGGAFANGSALQGGGVGETFGRDDIHARTAGADRGLIGAGAAGAVGMHRISKDEARDAKRLSKMIKVEGKTEAAAVKGAIRELESLQKVQRAAHAEELKAQQKHAKFTRVEHKARLRFLKEKERYEKVEAELRSIEADYEAKREHAAQQTDLLAEKTQELNDLRAQKAADDRERELKLLALKNPGHA